VVGGIRSATTDSEALKRQYYEIPSKPPNLGIYLAGSSLLAFDIDERHGATIESLGFSDQSLRTSTVKTGNGHHLYYSVKPGEAYSQSAQMCPEGVDPKFEGYCVAPPSLHPSGKFYRWVEGLEPWNCSPRDLPDEALRFVKTHDADDNPASVPAPPQDLVSTENMHPYVAAALQDSLEKISNAPEGVRNSILNQKAFGLYQLCHAGFLAETELFTLLFNAGLSIGLEEDEVRRTLASSTAGARRRPRRVWPDLTERKSKRKKGRITMANTEATITPPEAPPVPDPQPAANVTVLFAQLKEAGITLRLDGETIWAAPGRAITPEIEEGIRTHKAELLSVLRARKIAATAVSPDNLVESEVEGGLDE
jgi:hypothetical protein